MQNLHEEYAQIFKAFCDPKRIAILQLLQSGETCACVLIEKMNIGQSGLSYHMKILCESRIVDSRQQGKWMHYRLSETGSNYAMQLLKQLTTPLSALPKPLPDAATQENPSL